MIAVGTVGNTRSRVPVDSVACFQVVFGDIVVEVAVNKTRIGLRIGSDRVPDRIGLESSLLVQNHYFEKSCSNNDTGGSEFFFRDASVINKKQIVFNILPGLKFTIRLKIIGKMV